jgi:hypothetical protein
MTGFSVRLAGIVDDSARTNKGRSMGFETCLEDRDCANAQPGAFSISNCS